MKYFACALIMGLAVISSAHSLILPPPLCGKQVCTTDYNPVCGRLERSGQTIYRTFSNECTLHAENCQHPATPYVKTGLVGKTCAEQQLVSTCSKVCYGLYLPVCGLQQKGGQKVYHTFSNNCAFWQANCQHPDRQFVQQGKDGQTCDELGLHNACTTACYSIELPVCGLLHTEGQKIYKTFGNDCYLEQANCENPKTPYVQQGNAGQSCAAQGLYNQCSKACPKNSDPRCGKRTLPFGLVQYRTFGNNCLLVQQNCRFPRFAFHTIGEVGKTCLEQS